MIGDYGILTIMNDAKTKTRILSGAFDYVAPEIFDSANAFDTMSDVWTIGTTLLDMCTTSLYDHKQFHLHLLNLRHDDELLSKILKQIYEVYESSSLIHILKSMLNKKREQRPSIKAIIHDDFVQRCLELLQSELVLYTPKKQHTTDFSSILPKEHSFEKLAAFIRAHPSEENLVEAACVRLVDIAATEDFDLKSAVSYTHLTLPTILRV